MQTAQWDSLLSLARRQSVAPLLYHRLRGPSAPQPPPPVLSKLRLLSHVNAARNQQLMDELDTLLTLFRSHGIAAIPYKGPVLAATVYGDLTLRACGDLDILLRPTDILRAGDLLRTVGYQPEHQFRDAREEAEHLRADCEYNFRRASDAMLVELHWHFRPRFFPLPLDMDGLWDRARTVQIGSVTVLTLAPEDLLLVLCVHGAKHCWERLGWICDVAALLRALPDLDGRALAAQAKGLGCERVLWLGLALAQDLLGIAPPDSLRSDTSPVVSALAAQVRRQFFEGPGRPLDRSLFHLRVRDRMQDRLPYVRHRIRRQFWVLQQDWKSWKSSI
ncbi:MAG: nucleotidyltransferase family protein [Armatimonadetes bacterium]|nr:nucleotidyltransferase family protein [Armatimonadota bacterium]